MQKKIIFFISVNPFKNIHNSCILNRVGGAVALKEQEGQQNKNPTSEILIPHFSSSI